MAYKTPYDLDPSMCLWPHPLPVCPVHAQPSLATLALRFLGILVSSLLSTNYVSQNSLPLPVCNGLKRTWCEVWRAAVEQQPLCCKGGNRGPSARARVLSWICWLFVHDVQLCQLLPDLCLL